MERSELNPTQQKHWEEQLQYSKHAVEVALRMLGRLPEEGVRMSIVTQAEIDSAVIVEKCDIEGHPSFPHGHYTYDETQG